MKRKFVTGIIFAGLCLNGFFPLSGQEVLEENLGENDSLTIDKAIFRTIYAAPDVQAAQIGTSIRGAERLQAGLRPNPEFVIQYGDIDMINSTDDNEGNQLSYGIAQLIELGGKRAARIELSEAEEFVAWWELELAKRDIKYEVVRRFIAAAEAQEIYLVAEQQNQIAKNLFEAVSNRVSAGKESIIQQNKAAANAATALLAVKKAERALHSTKQSLAAVWGECKVDFSSVDFPFYLVSSPCPLEDVCKATKNNLELIRFEYEISAAYSHYNLAKREAIPDVVVSAEVEHKHEFKRTCFGVGLVIPIPIFNRNQGNICKASLLISQKEVQLEKLKANLSNEILALHEELMNAYDLVVVFRDQVLELSRKAYIDISEGFNQGKFNYLEVLDTQRSLFENEISYINFLTVYHQRKAELEKMVGVRSYCCP